MAHLVADRAARAEQDRGAYPGLPQGLIFSGDARPEHGARRSWPGDRTHSWPSISISTAQPHTFFFGARAGPAASRVACQIQVRTLECRSVQGHNTTRGGSSTPTVGNTVSDSSRARMANYQIPRTGIGYAVRFKCRRDLQ